MARYVALVDGRSGSYGLTVPDLPGCTSAAATIDEVLRRATEAVRLWAEDALADGEKPPKPRSIEAVRADPEVAAALAHGAVLAIVPLVRDAGRPVKANLSLDAGLLAAIDEAAAARGLTRSAFLASAAREKIETQRDHGAIPYAMRSSGTLSASAIFFKAAVVPFLRPLSRSEI
jgi:predicted RNase H-like HicB family nuclease